MLAETRQSIDIEVVARRCEEIRGGRLSAIPDETLRDAFVGAFEGMVAEHRQFLGGETIGELLDRVLPGDRAAARRRELGDRAAGAARRRQPRDRLVRADRRQRYFLGNLSQAPGCINALDVGAEPADWVVRMTNYAPSDLLQPGERETTMEVLYGQYLKFSKGKLDSCTRSSSARNRSTIGNASIPRSSRRI